MSSLAPDDAFTALGLTSSATAGEVRAAWQRLASIHHPDKGGDAATFARLRHAYTAALAWAELPKVCGTCGGSGRQKVARGFSQITLSCDACSGSGKA